MRIFSTIISLIFMVAFAHTTKMVSYSDIVYSLMEVTDEPQNLKDFDISFIDSMAKLQAFDLVLKARCSSSKLLGENKLVSFNGQIEALEKSKSESLKRSEELYLDQEYAKSALNDALGTIQTSKNNIFLERGVLSYHEQQTAERINIYRRLLSFIDDELTGEQKTTEMGKYNVDKSFTGQTSFAQIDKIKNNLATIAKKATDPVAKSIITTLITISSNGSFFASQELVNKFQELINTLISKEYDSFRNARDASEKNIESYNNLINEKYNVVDEMREKSAMNAAEITGLQQNVRNLENEIASYRKNIEKQNKKNSMNFDLCTKQDELFRLHFDDLQSFQSQVEELKAKLA